ncbi:MAG: peptide chain release factor N(5)-glutamine methyltransferase [Leptospiraceae bacterium]|nr:peptide chain release factor N(5)-glutamine methyltransferase [Leptospiraceae bacterium]
MKFQLHKLWSCLSHRLTNFDHPRNEVYYILKLFFSLSDKDFLLNSEIKIDSAQWNRLIQILQKRNQHVPIAYLFSRKEFYSLSFYVNESVLIPRPETELLVEIFLKEIQNKKELFCLDVGTGSGCIPISILNHTENIHYFLGIDISENAIKIANFNKKQLLSLDKQKILEFQKIDFLNEIYKINYKFDFIISNPPYVLPNEYLNLEKDLFYEPKIALLVENPYQFYEQFFNHCYKLLNKNGFVLLESSPTLLPIQIEILNQMNFESYRIEKDYQALDRFLIIRK